MNSFLVLSILSFAMLAGCYIAGTIPLVMPMSEVSYLLSVCINHIHKLIDSAVKVG